MRERNYCKRDTRRIESHKNNVLVKIAFTLFQNRTFVLALKTFTRTKFVVDSISSYSITVAFNSNIETDNCHSKYHYEEREEEKKKER